MKVTNYWARTTTRRRFIRAGAAGVAGAAFLAACGGDDESSDSTGGSSTGGSGGSGITTALSDTSDKAKRGGTLKSFLTGEPSTLDPMVFDTPLMNNIKNIAYSMLIREKPGHLKPQDYKELAPNIAESWEYSPDRLRITMKIRQDAKFHNKAPINGRAMDIEDVVKSWERYEAKGNYRGAIVNKVNPAASIESFTAVDKQTLAIKLANPAANVLNLLAHPYHGRYVVMPKETDGTFDPKGNMIGTGPFVQSAYTPGSGLTFTRHQGYWDPKRPYVDTVEDPFISDYPTRVSQLKAGNIYAAGGQSMTNEDILTVKSEVPQLNLYMEPPYLMNTSAERFGFMPAGQSPFKDERVRQAFSLALDRDLFIETFGGYAKMQAAGIPAETFWASAVCAGNFFWLDPKGKDFGADAKYYQHNIAEAKSLLAAAGHANGVQVPAHRVKGLEYGPAYHPQSDVIEQMIGDAGFKAVPDPQDFTTVYVRDWLQGNGKYDGFVHTRAPLTGNDPVTFFSDLYWSKGGTFFLGFDANGKGDASGDPKIDGLVEKLRVEYDSTKQQQLAFELQRSLAKSMYTVLFPGSATALYAAWPVVSNFMTEIGVYGYSGATYHDVYNWWLDTTKAPIA